jgi:uncharacterized protein YbjQ (UPF0145 family)
MTIEQCVRCNKEISSESAQTLQGLVYCKNCSEKSIQKVEEKKQNIELQKKEIVQERNVIEKALDVVSEDDTRHIIISTTDTIEGRNILDYIDIISVQDLKFQFVQFDPVQGEGQSTIAEEEYRNSIELSLSKLKKRAYLVGADAVVGVRIGSSIDHQRESEYTAAIMFNVNVSGTAVRLANAV